ncbi:MAG: DUF5777 family beta-barrel protein [Luteibaculaceae bacterium]
MKMQNKIITAIFVFLLTVNARAQEDLLDFLNEIEETETEFVSATFKGTKVINTQSIEMVAPGVLQFMIQHRFGTVNLGAYELWGLDQAVIRFGLDYGINDWLSVGAGRTSFQKTYDGNVKARLLRQTLYDNSMPVSVAWVSSAFINTLRWSIPERENEFAHRLSYAHQIIIARKFSESLSMQLAPILIHKNLVDLEDRDNQNYAVAFGGRQKLTKRLAVTVDYIYLFERSIPDDFTNSLSFGFDVETGGHVFQLHLTNSRGMFERNFVAETPGRWQDGDIFFGFNISRVFTVKDKRKPLE